MPANKAVPIVINRGGRPMILALRLEATDTKRKKGKNNVVYIKGDSSMPLMI
ncbi:MAG: hypothetical protein IPI79_00125 [Moraxellaceae bacterium]|nr:hypothetical protein [Moraxellaceae bacterium]